MGAPDVLARVAAAGVKLTALPDGRLWAEPAARLTDELRSLIRTHKAALLAAITGEPLPDPAAEERRLRALRMLAENPSARYAALTETRPDAAAVTLTLAIRDLATLELRIPRDKHDGTLLLDLIERHGGTIH